MAIASSLSIKMYCYEHDFLITCKNFCNYLQLKILMWLQKSSAGGDEKLLIKFYVASSFDKSLSVIIPSSINCATW